MGLWEIYKNHLLKQSPENIGKNLNQTDFNSLSKEQKQQLLKLKEETYNNN